MAFPPFFQRPKGALLRISILRLLNEESMHGYELMKRIEQHTEGVWIPSHSLLYNTLGNLEEQGFVTSKKEYKGEVERIVYFITKEGKVHLDEEITQIANMISKMMTSATSRPFPQLPGLLIERLPPQERKDFLIQIRNRLNDTLEEVDKELAKIA